MEQTHSQQYHYCQFYSYSLNLNKVQKLHIKYQQLIKRQLLTQMGACQCSKQSEMPDVNKMGLSKFSTGDNFHNSGDLSIYNAGKSRLISESVIKSRLHKVNSNQDHRIDSVIVKNTYRNLPATQASRLRDLMIPEQQLYIKDLAAKYVGELSQGKPHGYGKLYFDNNDFLQGTFVNGRCQGKGRFIKSDGSYYDGDFKNNVADGYGLYLGKKGFRYEGQWKNNVPNGSGQATYPDGSRYIGQFLNNKKNGKGTLYQNGNVYRGDFKNQLFDGRLRYQGSNGQTYEGQWRQGKKHGYGLYNWPDGSSYQGQYFSDLKHGKGLMNYSNGQVYDGQWFEGKKNGKGHIRSSKHNFSGVWRNGNLTAVIDE